LFRSESLDTQAVQAGCAVQKDILAFNDLVEGIPDNCLTHFDEPGSTADIVSLFTGDQLADDERLEEFQSHHLRQTALVDLQFRAGNDYRATGVVNTFTQKVLAEAALLTLQHVT